MKLTKPGPKGKRRLQFCDFNPKTEVDRERTQKNTARLMPHPKQQSEDEDEDEDEKEEFAQAAETLQDSGTRNTKPDALILNVETKQVISR